MREEKKFVVIAMVRNLFMLISIIGVMIFFYNLSIYLFIGVVSGLVAFLLSELLKKKIEEGIEKIKKEYDNVKKS